jgi:hypothetical protein
MCIDVETPKEKIWPFQTNTDEAKQWYFLFEKLEYVGLKNGEMGAHLILEEKFSGLSLRFNCLMTECGKIAVWLLNRFPLIHS